MKTKKTVMRVGPTMSALVAVGFATSMVASSSLQAQTSPPLAPVPMVAAQAGDSAPQISHLPLIRTSRGYSLNWSGYAVSTPNVTSVAGTFTVPEVGSPGTVDALPADVSAWVGIDGYTSGTVEQIGVSGSYDDATGTATYYSWWEMFPRTTSIIRSMAISAGDSITACVVYNGRGNFTLSIADTTSGQSFTKTVSAPTGGPNAAQRNSAEWVVERAATIYKGYITILPLATFDSTTFTDGSFTVGNGSAVTLQYATDNYPELTDPNNPPTQPYYEKMIMAGVDSNGDPYPLDSISDIAGNVFTADFLDNGTPFPIPGVYRQN